MKWVAVFFELENKVGIQIKANILLCVSEIQSLGWHLKVTPSTSLLFFDASVLSQSISHLILVLSPVDAADVVSGAYGRQDKGSAQAW